jgi:glycosyltransferase involved in cell wall biosynthesis
MAYSRAAMETNGTTPLRVLFVTSGLSRGGAETFLVRLASRLTARGHACAVASFDSNAPLAAPLVAAGVEIFELGRGLLIPALRLRRAAARFRPDAVQGWMYRGNLAALAAVPLASGKRALVWSVRQGLNDLTSSRWPTRWSILACARLSSRPFAIVYNADSARRQHEGLGFDRARSRVIPNGIDVATMTPPVEGPDTVARASLGLPAGSFVVAFLARWHPVKNHRGFLRAAGLFARERPQARFLMAGAGIDGTNATLASWLRQEGITDRVVLLGDRPDVPSLLAAADIATLASHGEALPNVLIEAMAAGRPCVAPDVGDVAALVATTGIVVRADDPRALAEGWEELAVMTDAERRALGQRARARIADRYGLDRAVLAFEAVYAEAVGARREKTNSLQP